MTSTRRPQGPTFLGAPFVQEPATVDAEFAFIGIPLCVPYGPAEAQMPAACTGAPDWVRAAAAVSIGEHDHYDFDLGAPLAEGGGPSLVDCGDVAGDPRDAATTGAAASALVRELARRGAVPLVVGGDHCVPPVVVRELDDRSPLDVLHIDAHLDFRDEVGGVRDGYSSPIRRLRELPFVRDIVQVGLRGTGSARRAEVEAAVAAGNVLITADQVHEETVAVVLDKVRAGARYYITIDVDGLDPGCAPAAGWPLPGGLTYPQVARLVRHIARDCEVAGIDICEMVPDKDVNGITGLAAARLLLNIIGLGGQRRRAQPV